MAKKAKQRKQQAAKAAAQQKEAQKKETVQILEEPKPVEDVKLDPVVETIEEPAQPPIVLEPTASTKVATTESLSVDAWFAAQRRDLEAVTARMHGSPLPKPSNATADTPPSMKDWAKEHQTQSKKDSLFAASFGAKKKAPKTAVNASTTELGFDKWLERRRAELSNISGVVDEASKNKVTTEEWRAKLDKASQETLSTWRKTTAKPSIAVPDYGSSKFLKEHNAEAEKSLRALNQSLAKVKEASDSHKHRLQANELSIEEVQWTKLNNLSSNFADRMAGAVA